MDTDDKVRFLLENYMAEYDARIKNIERSVHSIEKKIDDLYNRWHKAAAGAIALLVAVILGLVSYIGMTAGM